jgi:hypothetical protein
MSGFASRHALSLAGALVLPLSLDAEVAAQPGYVPVLQSGPGLWQHPFGVVFPPVPASAVPTWQDPTSSVRHGTDLAYRRPLPSESEAMGQGRHEEGDRGAR